MPPIGRVMIDLVCVPPSSRDCCWANISSRQCCPSQQRRSFNDMATKELQLWGSTHLESIAWKDSPKSFVVIPKCQLCLLMSAKAIARFEFWQVGVMSEMESQRWGENHIFFVFEDFQRRHWYVFNGEGNVSYNCVLRMLLRMLSASCPCSGSNDWLDSPMRFWDRIRQ